MGLKIQYDENFQPGDLAKRAMNKQALISSALLSALTAPAGEGARQAVLRYVHHLGGLRGIGLLGAGTVGAYGLRRLLGGEEGAEIAPEEIGA